MKRFGNRLGFRGRMWKWMVLDCLGLLLFSAVGLHAIDRLSRFHQVDLPIAHHFYFPERNIIVAPMVEMSISGSLHYNGSPITQHNLTIKLAKASQTYGSINVMLELFADKDCRFVDLEKVASSMWQAGQWTMTLQADDPQSGAVHYLDLTWMPDLIQTTTEKGLPIHFVSSDDYFSTAALGEVVIVSPYPLASYQEVVSLIDRWMVSSNGQPLLFLIGDEVFSVRGGRL